MFSAPFKLIERYRSQEPDPEPSDTEVEDVASEFVKIHFGDEACLMQMDEHIHRLWMFSKLVHLFIAPIDSEERTVPLHVSALAVSMVLPLDQIQQILLKNEGKTIYQCRAVYLLLNDISRATVKASPKPSKNPKANTTHAAHALVYNTVMQQEVKKVTLQRDNNRCAITDRLDDNLRVVRIFGITADHGPEWAMTALEELLALWPKETAKTWIEACRNKLLTVSAANMLTMHPDLYKVWKEGWIGLKPLPPPQEAGEEENANIIQIEVHWLRRNLTKPSNLIVSNGMDADNVLCTMDGYYNDNYFISGDVITIQADNPKHLPSRTLLELQWTFSRMAAISGLDSEYWKKQKAEK